MKKYMSPVILVGLGLLNKAKKAKKPLKDEKLKTINATDKKEEEKMLTTVAKEANKGNTNGAITPEFSEAIVNQALAEIELKNKKFSNVNAARIIGSSFPEVDELDITKNYINFRRQGKEKALETTRKLYKTFTTGALGTMRNRDGVVIGRIEVPKNKEGLDYSAYDSSSYRMIEYKEGTKEIKAITRVYNHKNFELDWDDRFAPYMERIEYGDTPDEDTFLRATFSSERKGDRYILTPRVTLYAEGYRTDDKICGKRSANKWLSAELYDKFESYRENYSAPEYIFNGHMEGMPTSSGLDGETFDRALDYPTCQMKGEDTTLLLYHPTVNLEGKLA